MLCKILGFMFLGCVVTSHIFAKASDQEVADKIIEVITVDAQAKIKVCGLVNDLLDAAQTQADVAALKKQLVSALQNYNNITSGIQAVVKQWASTIK